MLSDVVDEYSCIPFFKILVFSFTASLVLGLVSSINHSCWLISVTLKSTSVLPIPALYSFCAIQSNGSSNYLDWCTVAPSDGIYYNSSGIPEWTNSLLVTTLKNGSSTDMEVMQFKLLENGKLAPSSSSLPTPTPFFGEDQNLNGRLRDIAVSPSGKTIFLINNGGTNADKITVYNYVAPDNPSDNLFWIYPNPSTDQLTLEFAENSHPTAINVADIHGKLVYSNTLNFTAIDVKEWLDGMYFITAETATQKLMLKYIKQ